MPDAPQAPLRPPSDPDGTPAGKHAEEITDPGLQARLRARYRREMEGLQALGFFPQTYCLEVLGPYSAIWNCLVLLLMLTKREVLAFPSPLRLAVGTVLLGHPSPPSIAVCMGLGVKFYTDFTDGWLLVTPTFHSHAVPGPGSPILKNPPCPVLEDAWQAHRKLALELEGQGKTIRVLRSFADYVTVFNREEDESQYVLP